MNGFTKYIPTNRNVITFIVVAVLILLLMYQCDRNSTLKTEVEQVQMVADRNFNNYKASQDTITIERNKNGELVAIKLAYEFDINSLTEANKKLIATYQSSLNLNKDLKNVNSLLKAEIKIKDSIINAKTNVITINDTLSIVKFSDEKKWDKYNWRRFNGNIGILRNSKTNILTIDSSRFDFVQGMELKAAILNENGVNSLKISTPYPGVTFTNIENINLVNDKLNEKYKKKAGWSVGVGVGYGVNLTPGQVVGFGPSINIGLMWSPKWLRF